MTRAGILLLLVGLGGILTGVVPLAAVGELAERVGPVLGFVVAVTVVAELAAAAGVFDRLAAALTRISRGRTVLLFGWTVLAALVSTIFLSLDTTAVLLTPVVVAAARQVGVSPLPFALGTVWLANTASLLLPVSNLTNLLALHHLPESHPLEFASRMALPAVAAVLVTVLMLMLVFRRSLFTRFDHALPAPAEDPVLYRGSALVLGALAVALVSGVEVWIPATIAAGILVALFAWRDRRPLRLSLIPWRLLLFCAGLFLSVEYLLSAVLGELLNTVVPGGTGTSTLLAVAGIGLVGANTLNNLPAYLLLEPTTLDAGSRTAALLIGVNVGPLITPWASLATLLWHQRMEKLGVHFGWWRYAGLGLILAPLAVLAATLLVR